MRIRLCIPILLAWVCACERSDNYAETHAFIRECAKPKSIVCKELPLSPTTEDCAACGPLWRNQTRLPLAVLLNASLHDIGHWIERNSPQRLQFDRSHIPEIKFVHKTVLYRFVPRSGTHRPVAIYIPLNDGFILLDEQWVLNVWTMSYIVHEMVHHLQYQNQFAKLDLCVGALEPLAYSLQIKWLQQRQQAPIEGLSATKAQYTEWCGE